MYTYNNPKPKPFIPPLHSAQIERTSKLLTSTNVRVKYAPLVLASEQFHALAIDENFGTKVLVNGKWVAKPKRFKGNGQPKAETVKIDWEALARD